MNVSADFVSGNYTPKYTLKNPLLKAFVERFLIAWTEILPHDTNIRSVAEIGAGEGELAQRLALHYPTAQLSLSDISPDMVHLLKSRFRNESKRIKVKKADVEKLSYPDQSFDLVVVCEVMEHVEEPELAIQEIFRVARRYVVVSVPNEPIWRLLNMIRGKYWNEFGNTPGHVNHWSAKSFEAFVVKAGFSIRKKKAPLPWTMLLLEKK